ncbi:PucR family transcriptional regulator [Natribacillus halophilus]|uniref:PucR C-terminal helix-turn-helix domain-containing protein n=1 Tax=Natribacillus halophilus TaxID=549003 RepID=A0A1G8N403_9BACI|nr:helix-turn-helix domain-containing protein [Natribacillus halophilus]SDI74922.1 PucR C-terminal helix-turn-helix domain-containing protein [Natribacillus halophilus]
MIEQLKELYPEHIVYHPSHVSSPETYAWFYTQRYEVIGLPHEQLSPRERALLGTFLQRVPLPDLYYEDREKQWAAYLNGDANLPTDKNKPYRFYHFFLSHTPDDQETFTATLRNADPFQRGNIIWLTEREGVIITEGSEPNQHADPSLFSFLQALQGDFMLDIHMYRAKQHLNLAVAKVHFQREQTRFQHFKTLFPSRLLFTPSEEMLIDLFVNREWQSPISNENDEELLKTVFVYLQSQLNLSKAAKRLHIHRNTLQYRLDKFQERNGPLLNDFSTIVPVYIAIWLTGEYAPFMHIDEDQP